MFRTITIGDMDAILPYLAASGFDTSEYCFANNYIWSELNGYRYCISDGFYILGSFTDGRAPQFIYPAGNGDIRRAVDIMRCEIKDKGCPLTMLSLNEASLKLMRSVYGNTFTAKSEPMYSDYFLDVDEASEPTGNRGKKCRKFDRDYAGRVTFSRILTAADKEKCIMFSAAQYNDKGGADLSETSAHEQLALHMLFEDFERLRAEGIMMYIDGVFCGFTCGSPVNDDTFDCHFEKADRAAGRMVFSVLSREFARSLRGRYKYINIEEDLGIPGLIESKRTAHPVRIAAKTDITFNV